MMVRMSLPMDNTQNILDQLVNEIRNWFDSQISINVHNVHNIHKMKRRIH